MRAINFVRTAVLDLVIMMDANPFLSRCRLEVRSNRMSFPVFVAVERFTDDATGTVSYSVDSNDGDWSMREPPTLYERGSAAMGFVDQIMAYLSERVGDDNFAEVRITRNRVDRVHMLVLEGDSDSGVIKEVPIFDDVPPLG